MPVVPTYMSGLRPHLSTVAMAMRVKNTPEPPMIACANMPASTPVSSLMLLKMVVPKYMKTLMPVTCWRMAKEMPRISGILSRGENSSRHVDSSPANDPRMAADSSVANPSPATLERMMRACSSRLRSISQRGLSGMKNSSRANTTAGSAPDRNIQRQPWWIFHESPGARMVATGLGSSAAGVVRALHLMPGSAADITLAVHSCSETDSIVARAMWTGLLSFSFGLGSAACPGFGSAFVAGLESLDFSIPPSEHSILRLMPSAVPQASVKVPSCGLILAGVNCFLRVFLSTEDGAGIPA